MTTDTRRGNEVVGWRTWPPVDVEQRLAFRSVDPDQTPTKTILFPTPTSCGGHFSCLLYLVPYLWKTYCGYNIWPKFSTYPNQWGEASLVEGVVSELTLKY